MNRRAWSVIVALGTDRGVAVEQAFGVPEAAVAAQRTVETLETALQGPLRGVARRIGVVGHMPFARHGRMVAARAERLGQRHGVRGQCAAVTRIAAVGDHVPDARKMGREAREHTRPRGTAARRVVELAVAESVGGQRIEVRGGDFTAETAQIAESQVVGKDQHDVGPCVGRSLFTAGRKRHGARYGSAREADFFQSIRFHVASRLVRRPVSRPVFRLIDLICLTNIGIFSEKENNSPSIV